MNPIIAAALQRDKTTIDPSLRLYIPFNEGIGIVAKDYSQYGNNGVLTDVEWGIQGGVFNGTSTFANCGSDSTLEMTTDTTIAAWIKISSEVELYDFVSKSNIANENRILFRVSSGALQCFKESNNDGGITITGGTLNANQWHFGVVVFGSQGYKIYLDGVEVGSDADTAVLLAGTDSTFQIGRKFTGSNYFNGAIDGVKIYNRALSALEILTDYESERDR